jgi:hypothetical protein
VGVFQNGSIESDLSSSSFDWSWYHIMLKRTQLSAAQMLGEFSDNAFQCKAYISPISHPVVIPFSYKVLHILEQIIQIVIIIPSSSSPVHDNLALLLLLLLGHGAQELFELLLCDFGAQLAGAGEHDETVLDVGGAGLFDEADAADAVGGLWGQDLGEDGVALFGCGWVVSWCGGRWVGEVE